MRRSAHLSSSPQRLRRSGRAAAGTALSAALGLVSLPGPAAGPFAGVFALAAFGLASGCASDIARPRSGDWPFAPASLRVHPLSRILLPPQNAPRPARPRPTIVEAYVELFDQDGFDTRGLGTLHLELTARGDASLPPLQWSIDLNSLSTNRRHFDRVTMTYRFPLQLEWPRDPRTGAASLHATLEIPDGRRLQGSREIRWPTLDPADAAEIATEAPAQEDPARQ